VLCESEDLPSQVHRNELKGHRENYNRILMGAVQKGNFNRGQNVPECEISAETRTLQDLEGIIKCNGFCGRVEGDRKQATITAVGVAKAIVQGARGAVLWVVNILD
jgi:hypothetical protein